MSADTTSGFTFAYFTDTHVALGATISAPDGAWEIDTNETLRKVVSVLGELEESPAFGVIGGDLVSPDLVIRDRSLADEDYEPSYGLLRDILSPLEYPIHMLLGNHDSRPAFHRVMETGAALDAPHDYSFDFQGYHFAALDSLDVGKPGGRLTENQMDWLRIPGQAEHRIRSKPITCSGRSRSPNPRQADHRIQPKPITDSKASRSL